MGYYSHLEEKSGVLLAILQGAGQPPPPIKHHHPQLSVADTETQVESPARPARL